MPRHNLDVDVLTAARARIALAFDNFERYCVSFSGGKDSTVLLHLVMEEAIKRDRKVGVLFIDLEAQYSATVDLVTECFEMYKDHIDPLWVCLPIHLRNAVSVYEPFWICWDPNERDSWVRQPPALAITDPAQLPFFRSGMEFEEFLPEFANWYSCGKPTAFFVGIRTVESYNRHMAIAITNKKMWRDLHYTTGVSDNSESFNFYPIFDWKTRDIWIYHGKNPKLPHNRLYDLMHLAGLSIHQMRICQPYGDDQRRGLWLFHLIEPGTWAKIIARVNGANGGAMFTQESGNVSGYRKISKPPHLTWKQFANVLVASMPDKTREHYQNKIIMFRRWYETLGYPDDIPDEADYQLELEKKAPSWRRVCKSLLRNDFWCKGLGFYQQKSAAYDHYLEIMRKRRMRWGLEGVGISEVHSSGVGPPSL